MEIPVVISTYYKDSKVNRLLKHTLNFLYARSILGVLDDVVKEHCYGCEIDHPSQTQHTCLMWTKAEHLDIYFDKAFEKVIYASIVSKMRKQVEIMDIPLDSKDKLLNDLENWCYNHKPKQEDLRSTTERLFSLENRFEDDQEYF